MGSVFTVQIPSINGILEINILAGSSVFFLGANGGGKTRLASKIEENLGLKAHRISAHRALSLNPRVPKVSEEEAINSLLTGVTSKLNITNRSSNRWHGKSSTDLLNDFNYLLQVLFAQQNNTALLTHKANRTGSTTLAQETNFEKLSKIWENLLPHRVLDITGDNIRVIGNGGTPYDANEMSDGERAIFYLIGQALCAQKDSLLIFDEPELHIHRGIMSRLWDELEAARPDCAFILISHDLEFIASRIGQKFVIRDYVPPGSWVIEQVPIAAGFSEETTTQILGSRKAILFVEGSGSSLDLAIYRSCYPDLLVVPRGSCENVIHAVVTMRGNSMLTRITCAGIVDSDSRTDEEVQYLRSLGIETLKVSEIENLFLLPRIASAIGVREGYDESTIKTKIDELVDAVISTIKSGSNLEDMIIRHCKRRIDNALKKLDLSETRTISDLNLNFVTAVNSIQINLIESEIRDNITESIANRDLEKLLSVYDNKGFVAITARIMKNTSAAQFENWIIRNLGNNSIPDLTAAFRSQIPSIIPR